MSNKNSPEFRSLEDHKKLSKKEYYQFFADGPEDAARILHVLDDGDGQPTAYPRTDGFVYVCVDKVHELFLKMDPDEAARVGAEMLAAAGFAEAIRVFNQEKEKRNAQSQAADQGSRPAGSGD